ncbi:MAG: hypothetical protein AAFO89_14300, partial [Planctomycetota bacterium]
ANSRVDGGYGLMLFTSKPADNEDLLVADNVIDDFGTGLRIDIDDVVSTTVRDNVLTRSRQSPPLVVHRGASRGGVSYDGNKYWHRQSNRPFEFDRRWVSLRDWRSAVEPQGRRVRLPGNSGDPYVNGSATLTDYARSIGFADDRALMNAMRQQRRGNWDERLTPGAISDYFRDAFTLRIDQ